MLIKSALVQSKDVDEYKGPLYKTDNKKVRTAVECVRNQIARCNNPNNPRYKDNGAKGIKVYYTIRQFVTWYLNALDAYEGEHPSVGRIDHSKGYSFDNIRLESLAENSLERIARVGTTKPRKKVDIYLRGVLVATASSGKQAATYTGVQPSHISRYCQGTLIKSVKGFSFRYHDKEAYELAA